MHERLQNAFRMDSQITDTRATTGKNNLGWDFGCVKKT
jgi:hypothetical protein